MAPPANTWYDDSNRDALHEDLKANYAVTLATIMDRPRLQAHFKECVTCQGIAALKNALDRSAGPQVPHRELLRRRKKFVLDTGALTTMLDLPQNAAIMMLRVTGEGDVLEVTVCSPDYRPIAYGSEPDIAQVQLENS